MVTGFPTRSIMNSSLTLLLIVKLTSSFLTIHYNAGCTYVKTGKPYKLKVCMVTGLPTRSITKYNFFVNPFTSCKTDIIISNNTLSCSHTYTMQELVKEVTLINHMNNINGFAILHGITP